MSGCHIKQGKIRTMDNHDKATRSYNMSRIRSVNTRPEEMVRKYLFSRGFRYRKNDNRLLGKSYTDFVAETAQVSPDMPAAAILAALSVCLQGKAKIRFSPYWSEELNLYVLITAPQLLLDFVRHYSNNS